MQPPSLIFAYLARLSDICACSLQSLQCSFAPFPFINCVVCTVFQLPFFNNLNIHTIGPTLIEIPLGDALFVVVVFPIFIDNGESIPSESSFRSAFLLSPTAIFCFSSLVPVHMIHTGKI